MSHCIDGQTVEDLFLFMRLRKDVQRTFDTVGFSLFEAMFLLYVGRGVREPKALRQLLDIHDSSLTNLANKLAGKQLLERGTVYGDARRVYFRLTLKGCVEVRKIEDAWTTGRH